MGHDGKIVQEAELFDPRSQNFEPISSTGLTARTRHTATLLTDGVVLIAGGLSDDGNPLDSAELWDPEDQTVLLSGKLNHARYGHTATLLGDGKVLLSQGRKSSVDTLHNGDLFDPFSQSIAPMSPPEVNALESNTDVVELVASLPVDGSVDVPLDSLIAIRFSNRVRVTTLNPDTVFLNAPSGPVSIKIVPAEDGMLAFINPLESLLPGTSYTVTLNGPVSRDGFLLAVSHFSFTTRRLSDPASLGGSGAPGFSTRGKETDSGEQGKQYDDFAWKGKLRDGKPHSPWQDLPPLRAEDGVTALSGQVLDLKGEPLVDVVLEVGYGSETVSARSDNTGRFLIKYIEAGESELLIDGRPGHNRRSKSPSKWGYGVFEYGLEIKDGKTNVLPFTIWLPKIDAEHAVKIPSPTVSEVIATTPYIPGLELHLPANTVVYDHDWNLVNEVGLTPIPLDRTPFPLPRNVEVPIYFTAQPGAGYVRDQSGGYGGARLFYPNYKSKLPGTRFNFWHYDPGYRGWYIYGLGTVVESGKQVIPDSGVSVRKFTGAMVAAPGLEPAEGKDCRDSDNCAKGDPVDVQTGIFQMEKTDLFLTDVMPIKFTRTYRTRDTFSRAFGIGASHSYDYFLIGDTLPYTYVKLVLPDGGTLRYDRIDGGAGNDFTVAVYEHTTRSGRFFKSKISWNSSGWDLKLKDGTLYVFADGQGATRPGQAGLTRMQDRNGNAHKITRDSDGNVTKIVSFPSGRWIEFTSVSNRITQAKDNSGRTVTYTYDGTGRLSTVTDPNNGVTEYTYDAFQRMETLKDARQIVFLTNEYDANGRVQKQTQADSTFFLFNYTLNGSSVIQADVTDPRGNVSRTTFNADGQITTNIEALGTAEEQTTTYERQAGTNLLFSVTDELNRKTAFGYDAGGLGNVTSVTRLADTPDAVTTSYTYEAPFNLVKTITDPLSHTTTFGYDTNGNLTTITDPLNKITTITPNSAGQPTSIQDPLNNITQFTYNAGDLVTVTDPTGNVTKRFTDAAGRLRSVTNPLGNKTLYDYDPLNRLTKVTDPLAGITEFTYDPNGNLRTVKDARNNVTEYTYNNMDRLATRIDPVLRVETYNTYDNNGNLTQFTDRKSQVTAYQYDPLNRRKKVTYHDSTTTDYVYDAGNRLQEIIDSVSGTITRDYDGLDRLTSETTPQGSVGYTYDDAGRRETMTVAGQPTVSYPLYDNANRLKRIEQGSSVVLFDYDDAGRRTSLTLPNGILVEYSYDAASRITSITYKQNGTTLLGNLTYDYDKAGNRTNVGGTWARTGIPQPISTTAYNAANHQTTFGDKTITFDNNGHLQTITDPSGTTTYAWNARNQLAGISGPGMSASFVYDGAGRREKKTISGNLTEFLYDGINPVQETSGTNELANILPGLGIDEFFSRTDVSTTITSHLLSDALGSTVALPDLFGTVQTEYTYEPFGKTTLTGSSTNSSYQFTARENDGTGLYHYRSRYYHPQLQRFISEDPIEFAGGDVNLYAYVFNNPTIFTDPTGESIRTICRTVTKWLRNHIGAVIIAICSYAGGEQGPQPPNLPPRMPPGKTAPKEGPKGIVPPVSPDNRPPDCGRKDCLPPSPPSLFDYKDPDCYEVGLCT
jgi:RHS repeat-associated protein